MATIRGCDLPDDLYHYTDKHVWLKRLEGARVRVGMNAVAVKLSGGKLAALTVKKKAVGTEVAQGKSIATVESSKYVGPVPTPVTGVLVVTNEKLAADPNLAVRDPYGEGWIAELDATRWDAEAPALVTGAEGLARYAALLEAAGISCA